MSGTNGGQDQSSTRRPGTVTDQHGRPWGCSIDKKSGFPVGLIYPKGWKAPWKPPMGPETVVFNKDNPTQFRINYEWLLEQRVKAADDYDSDRRKAAVVRGWDPSDPEKQRALDEIVGSRDGLQHPEVIVACMQGDKWILGLTDVVNPKVAKFVQKKERGATALLARFGNLAADEPETEQPASLKDDLDALMDIEESVDPEATPRGRVPVKPKKPRTGNVAA